MNSAVEQPRVRPMTFFSFDAGEEKPAAPAAPPPVQKAEAPLPPGPVPLPLQLPAITEKDMQAARADAQAAGYREGYAAAQGKFNKEASARDEAVKSLLEIIANRITLAAETHAAEIKEREGVMAKLVIAVARKVAGDALRQEPYATVEALLRDCLGLIAGEAEIKIVVSSMLAMGLRQQIDTLKPMLRGQPVEIVVEEDPHLLDQDCRVEWSDGRGERRTETLWKEIETIVMRSHLHG